MPPGKLQTALVPDSSSVEFVDSARRGQRLVYACCDEHMSLLVQQARRDWVDEQWWFELLCQASLVPRMAHASLPEVARRARLSGGKLEAALKWNAGCEHPVQRLPGGQPC
ncbi:hypothetical protein [Amycolatopsis benzoatilytica]|uniref:hypothetical protein n=1 Tax=Amycolatopsis benzoatilytica TaxID=346045 RepID=UPI0003817A21|nr:hypothetical protein [Amycolatopsis benzoatilytica]